MVGNEVGALSVPSFGPVKRVVAATHHHHVADIYRAAEEFETVVRAFVGLTVVYDCTAAHTVERDSVGFMFLIEADNNENDNAASPISHPTLKNLILAGNGESKQGIRLRRGTQVHIDNAKVCGKGQPLAIESTLTNSALKNGTSLLANMTISAELTTDGDYTNADFIAATGNKVDAALSYASFDAIKAECDWMNGNWVK